MKPLEVQPCLEVGGLVGLYLRSDLPIEKKVANALVRLSSCPSSDWERAMKLTDEKAVYIDVSLEQIAWLMERLDFSSGRAEDIEGIVFWPYPYAAMEFPKALGYEWTNQLGFDCHESYVVRWWVPEGMVGYLVWLARRGRNVALFPEGLRYHKLKRKRSEVIKSLIGALEGHVNRRLD
jgi:hypothetical protein